MIPYTFAYQAKSILEKKREIIGLAVGGSWLSNEIDEFSDLDLIVVTEFKISDDKSKMLEVAKSIGNLLSGFTGEHVGEPRLLICLYHNPLLHVDIKFLVLDELKQRVETPQILFDKGGKMASIYDSTAEHFPFPDYQWIEDRFWIWVHYALLKIGRGEYFEAYDFLAFLRMVVLGPLLHIKNGNLPRAVRKVEMNILPNDLMALKKTIPIYDRISILDSLHHAVVLYREFRIELYDTNIQFRKETEESVMTFFATFY